MALQRLHTLDLSQMAEKKHREIAGGHLQQTTGPSVTYTPSLPNSSMASLPLLAVGRDSVRQGPPMLVLDKF